MNNLFSNIYSIPDSDLLLRMSLPSNKVKGNIHDEYALEIDIVIKSALEEVNALRRSKRDELGYPLREHFASTRYRIISSPEIRNSFMELHLAPIDFAYVALLKDQYADSSIKAYIRDKISQVANAVEPNFKSYHPYLNKISQVPLGVEILIVTEDEKTLFRKRGMSVLTEAGDWDVSFSGYCGSTDVFDSLLHLGLSAARELKQEIGEIAADSQDIVFNGLHHNTSNGSIDMLGYWKIKASSNDISKLLSGKISNSNQVFATTERSEESFVWDAKNLIVDFDRNIIYRTLEKLEIRPQDFTPEAFACLLLALESTNHIHC